MGEAAPVAPAGARRGGDRLHREPVDRDPRHPPPGSRDDAVAADGRGDARDRDRPGRGDPGAGAVDPAQPGRAQGSEPPDRVVHLLRPHRRGQDRAGPLAGPVPVRGPAGPDPRRHERVYGEVLGVAADRRAAGLRRLRGFGHAHQGSPPQALQRGPAGRDREGPPRRVQHPAAGPRRGPPHGQLRPGDRLQEHGRHHDVERGRPRHRQGQDAGVRHRRRPVGLRPDRRAREGRVRRTCSIRSS